jgi:hypothetical protein
MAAEGAAKQAQSEAEAFERAMSRIKPKPDILREAAETIQRLGSAAQDCKSCTHNDTCTRAEDCEYRWQYADEVPQYDKA